ncbi:hypothetical protein U1Q18_000762 [Sarracenia purpurea var. burkii]
MLFRKEIEDLHNDGFEGSINEHHIFTEVFFGNDDGRISKRCLVTGAINFERDYTKQADVLLCSNSENSAVTSQVDSSNVKEDSRLNSRPGCASEGRASLTRNAHDVSTKRMKLSADHLPYSRPGSGGISNSSTLLKGVVSTMSQTALQFVFHTVTCRVVESSSHGVTSSCYLLKRHAAMNSGSDEMEVNASKAIASPVSQESFATKLLVTSPSAIPSKMSGSLQCAEDRKKPSNIHEPVEVKIASNSDSIKDPRPLLRNHIQNLFRAAGWGIGRRKRKDKVNAEFIYLSPQGGRTIREFRRAWNLCGESLFAHRKVSVQEDGKQWTDMTDFWSDLSNTLIKIEEELNNTETTAVLVHRWCLLDPFVNTVFIDKKLGTLKVGKLVKTRRCFVIDTSTKDYAVLASENIDSIGRSERYSLDWLCDTSLVRESLFTKSGGNYHNCNEKLLDGISAEFGELHKGTVKVLKGASVYLCDAQCTHFRDTISGTGSQHSGISERKRNRQGLGSLQACGVDSTSDHSGSCLFEVPIAYGNTNFMLGGSESFSPHQYSNIDSLSGDRHGSGHGEVMVLEFDKTVTIGSSEGGGKIFGGIVADKVENQFKGSLDDHLNRKNDGLAQSNYGYTPYTSLSTQLDSVSCIPSPGKESPLVYVDETDVMQYTGLVGKVSVQYLEGSEFEMSGASSVAGAILKRKMHKKSKKISEIKLATLCQNDRLGPSNNKAEGHDINENSICSDSGEVEESFVVSNVRSDRSFKNSFICSFQCQNEKKQSGFRNFHHRSCISKQLNQFSPDSEHSEESHLEYITDEASMDTKNESLNPENLRQDLKSEILEAQNGNGQKRSISCQLKDDDLLISAVINNKTFSSTAKQSTRKMNSRKSKATRRRKSQKSSCRLLPRSLGKGGKHMEEKWSIFGVRTVLSWLIDSGVVSLNDVIQFRSPKDDSVVKNGLVTRDGIFCKCCCKVLSVSEFKIHAGSRLNCPCLNLVMESGKPFTLCQLEAWSAEYKARKSATHAVQVEELDQNDDSCGLCGDGGELLCCDNCPSTFHQACLYVQELPEGSWYCSCCTCRICGDVVNDKEDSRSPSALKCSQCEHKYHESCLKKNGTYQNMASDAWFCRESCEEVYLGLQSRIGLVNLLCDGFSCTLLRCIHGDQRVHSAQKFVALKAECNSKLAVALTIMEECFLPMVDPRTGIDMIPHVLYNWGSQFARLNYNRFYTVVLEKDDVLMSVASIR